MNKLRETIAIGIFIFSLLAIAALLFSSSKMGFTGNVIENSEDAGVAAAATSCSDSDGGKNYFVSGIVKSCLDGICLATEDKCSGKKLIEQYCENGKIMPEEHECEFDCDAGVCLSSVKNYKFTGGSGGGSGGSAGGDSGGGSVVVPDTSQVHDLGNLSSESTIEIPRYDSIKFSIGSRDYTWKLDSFTDSQATFISSGANIVLEVGRPSDLDLDSDGNAEVYSKARAISTIANKVKITIGFIST